MTLYLTCMGHSCSNMIGVFGWSPHMCPLLCRPQLYKPFWDHYYKSPNITLLAFICVDCINLKLLKFKSNSVLLFSKSNSVFYSSLVTSYCQTEYIWPPPQIEHWSEGFSIGRPAVARDLIYYWGKFPINDFFLINFDSSNVSILTSFLI